MTIFGGISQSNISTNAQARLMSLRMALEAANDYYQWISAYSLTELEAIGYTATDAQALLSAFADAAQLYNLYSGGTLGNSYSLPYNFSASQRIIIGPQY